MQQRGFTLIELSIVLVIIGLIVGGIIGGKSLMESAEVRSMLSHSAQFSTMMRTFEMQYDAYAGDIRDATDYWPAQTVNGDADRKIEVPNSGSNPAEHFLLWEHMSLADIAPPNIDAGQFTGGSSSWTVKNIPETGVDGAYISAITHCIKINNSCTNKYRTSVTIGSYYSGDEGQYTDRALPTLLSKKIDNKIDDGIPRSGAVIGTNGRISNNCVVGGSYLSTGNTYDLTQTGAQCALYLHY